LKGNYFTNAAGSRITTNLEQEVRDYAYTFMYPEENTLTESTAASCSTGRKETPIAAQEATENSTTAKMKMSALNPNPKLHSKITVLNTSFQ